MIVHSDKPVVLVAGGQVSPRQIDAALKHGPKIVAADGGADHLLSAGYRPDAVIGDLDSISPASRQAYGDVLIEVTEQETTDFEKAVTYIDAPLIIAVGALGGQLDHQLANLHVLMAHPHKPCILLGEHSLALLCPPRLELMLPLGTRLSLFPLGSATSRSDGLEWPTNGLSFAPGARIGTSNRTSRERVLVEISDPAMILILPPQHLDAVAHAFLVKSQERKWQPRGTPD